MKQYIIRSIKYFVALVVLYAAIMWLMHLSQPGMISYAEHWQLLFASDKGWMMVVATVLLAATYPTFGFVKRSIKCDIARHREQLVTAFTLKGFQLHSESNCELRFRASGLRRVTMLFEDEIVVRCTESGMVEMDGLRRAVVPISLNATRYIENFERSNE